MKYVAGVCPLILSLPRGLRFISRYNLFSCSLALIPRHYKNTRTTRIPLKNTNWPPPTLFTIAQKIHYSTPSLRSASVYSPLFCYCLATALQHSLLLSYNISFTVVLWCRNFRLVANRCSLSFRYLFGERQWKWTRQAHFIGRKARRVCNIASDRF